MGKENEQIILIFILSAVFVVLLAILLILFLVIYQKRIVMQEHRLQQLENEKQQVLLKATIEGQERERERLAKDLHDSIGSLLSGLSLNLKFQKSQVDPISEQAKFLVEACEMLDDGIEKVRAVSHNLMPTTLDNFGLIAAIKECIAPINKTTPLVVDIDIIHESFRMSKEIETGLLRVFQELIQNTIKHAKASKVKVIVEFNQALFRMSYNDNGIGIDPKTISRSGIGLKNMQSRIQALDGLIKVEDTNKLGFMAIIEIPLASK